MSRSHANSQPNSAHNQSGDNSDPSPEFSHLLPALPAQTSDEAGWNSATLEYYHAPPGGTPEFCLDHYFIAIYYGSRVEIESKVEGIANGRLQKLTYYKDGINLLPMHHSSRGHWQQSFEGIVLSLKSTLLTHSAAELLVVDHVEPLPENTLYDSLILQIALALKADLESHRLGGQLYAETLTNTLAVHLLRNYSAHTHKSIHHLDGLSPTQLKVVTDYIHDHLGREVSLKKLAAIALRKSRVRINEA